MTVGYTSSHGQYVAARQRREAQAILGLTNARDALPTLTKGLSIFGVTRGNFSQIDIVLKYMDDIDGPVNVSVWTWVISEYEAQVFRRLMMDKRISKGVLVMGGGGKQRAADKKANHVDWADLWADTFGPGSVRYCRNHAKICTIQSADYKVLIRGSMNLNMNTNYEQFDVDEGHPGFDLVRSMEEEFPAMETEKPSTEPRQKLSLFSMKGIKTWRK